MIKSIPDLRTDVSSLIKVIPNNETSKTQGADVKRLLTDILDTVDDLVLQQGLSISASTDTKINAAQPNLSPYQLISTAFNGNYNNLVNKPDLTVFRLNTTAISYLDLINKPSIFSGSYLDLTNKPSIFDGNYNSLSNRPTLFDGTYTSLSGKPTLVTTYSQLAGLPTLFNGDYTTLTNKPVIPTSITKLLWNQTSAIPVNNTTTETDVLVTGNGSLNMDISPTTGTCYRIRGRGLFSTAAITAPSLTVKLYLGTTVIAQVTVSSFIAGASNRTFSFDTEILVTAANTVYAQGYFNYYAALSDIISTTPLLNGIGTTTTVDLSTIKQLRMTYTWSSAGIANTISTKIANFEKLN